MRFDIYYYDKDKIKLIRENVSKEDVVKYLKNLTIIERSHIYLEPIKEIIDNREEER